MPHGGKNTDSRCICKPGAGGNDDLVFTGASMVADENGRIIAAAQRFDEDMIF